MGEIDISNQVYWDTYNGKLRFNYNGINIGDTGFSRYLTDLIMNPDSGYPSGNIGGYPLMEGTHIYDPNSGDTYTVGGITYD